MTHKEQVVKDAWDAGYRPPPYRGSKTAHYAQEFGGIALYANKRSIYSSHYNFASLFLDPAFWQALGKSRGWEEENGWSGHVWGFEDGPDGENIIVMNWENAMLDFIHHLADGKDAESFFKNL